MSINCYLSGVSFEIQFFDILVQSLNLVNTSFWCLSMEDFLIEKYGGKYFKLTQIFRMLFCVIFIASHACISNFHWFIFKKRTKEFFPPLLNPSWSSKLPQTLFFFVRMDHSHPLNKDCHFLLNICIVCTIVLLLVWLYCVKLIDWNYYYFEHGFQICVGITFNAHIAQINHCFVYTRK